MKLTTWRGGRGQTRASAEQNENSNGMMKEESVQAPVQPPLQPVNARATVAATCTSLDALKAWDLANADKLGEQLKRGMLFLIQGSRRALAITPDTPLGLEATQNAAAAGNMLAFVLPRDDLARLAEERDRDRLAWEAGHGLLPIFRPTAGFFATSLVALHNGPGR